MIRVSQGVKYYRDGREVCLTNHAGNLEYKRRRDVMRVRQKNICCLCLDPTRPMTDDDCTFEHEDGRGMGGARRDDRIEKQGKPYNGAAHNLCNVLKGSKRGNSATAQPDLPA